MPDETTPTVEQTDLEATDASERLSPEDRREDEPTTDDTSPDPAADATSAQAAAPEDGAEAADGEAAETAEAAAADGADGEEAEAPSASFDDMHLDDDVLRALGDMGYEHPMEVQSAVYDLIQAGHDVMVQARTGTGKTAAFGIPMAQRIKAESTGAQALILAPTRELGQQVARELQQINQHRGLHVVPIYGGAPMKPQVDALAEGAQIVSGTPGRVLDHIRRGTLKTSNIHLLILDECDEMLSMGFQEEIDNIISFLPPREDRQTLLFSATIPDEIRRIAGRHMRSPETISLSEDQISVDEIDHCYYVVSGVGRVRDLLKVLKVEKPEHAIIFCNTKDDTSMVARFLQRQGYDALAISSDLTQRERERTMKRMRESKVQFMVATDVAARGIDITDLSHVINYTFPESPEMYVHRTGRTGRAGKRGTAISLVGPREIGAFYYLKLTYKIRPKECQLPTAEDLALVEESQRYEQVVRMVPDAPADQYLALARRLWQSTEGERVVGMLLQRLLEQPRGERADSAGAEKDSGSPRREQPRGKIVEQERVEHRHGDGRRRRGAGPDRDRERPRRGRRTSERDEHGAPRTNERGRRRRERRPGRPAEGAPQAADGETKEFWEAWADEKQASSGEGAPPERTQPEGAPLEDGQSERRDSRARESGTTRLYLNLGKREEITADEVRTLLTEGLDDAEQKIGSVAVRNTHCYVRVPEEMVDTIIDNARGKSFKDREVVIERARR